MGLLGDWLARVIIDTSQIGPALSGSEKDWKGYYQAIEQYDTRTTEFLKRSLFDLKGVQTRTRAETKAQLEQLNRQELLMVQQHAKDLLRADKQRLDEIKKQAQMVSDLKKQIATFASVAITIPIYIGTKKALQDFIEFKQEIQNIKAVIGGTIEEMDMLTASAIDLGEKMSQSPTKIAKAMFELGQAGLDATEIYNEIAPVMQLSAAGMKDLSFTAELLVTTLKAFQLESDQASRVADIFSSSNAKSVSSLDKLNASLKYTAGLWSSMGWSIEELVGTLDTLYDTGVRGEKAGRLLASAINGLQRPTAMARKAIIELLGSSDALSPAFNNISQIIGKMADAHAKTSDVVKIFGKESAEVINRLIQNYDQLGGNISEVTGQMGETARQANVQLDTMGKKWDQLKVTVSDISKSFIDVLEPSIKSVIVGLTAMVSGFKSLPDWVKALISSLIGMVAIAGPTAIAITKISTMLNAARVAATAAGVGFSLISGPAAIALASIVALSTAYVTIKKNQSEYFDSLMSGVDKITKSGKNVDDMVAKVRGLYSAIGDSMAICKAKDLQELADVFPKLREQLNKNSTDTAAAMRVLNDEYTNYLNLKAQMSKSTASTTDPQQARLQELAVTIDGARFKLNELWKGMTVQTQVIPALVKIDSSFGNIDKAIEKASRGMIDMDGVMKAVTATGEQWREGWPIYEFIRSLKYWSTQLKSSQTSYDELARKLQKPLETKIDSSNATKLLNNLDDLVQTINTEQERLRFQFDIDGTKASAAAVLDDIGKQVHDTLPDIMQGNEINLIKLGIFGSSGDLSAYFTKNIEPAVAMVRDKMKKYGAGWLESLMGDFVGPTADSTWAGSLSKMREWLSQIEALEIKLNDKTTPASDLPGIRAEYDKILAAATEYYKQSDEGNTKESSSIRGVIMALSAISRVYASAKDPVKEISDWWTKIRDEIKASADMLSGNVKEGISSLNERLASLKNKAGETFTEVSMLATELSAALAGNDNTRSISQLVTIESVSRKVQLQLEALAIAQAEFAGIPMPVEKYKNSLQVLEDNLQTLETMKGMVDKDSEAYKILSEAIDGVFYSIVDLKGAAGSISTFSYESLKHAKAMGEERKKAEDLKKAMESLASMNIDEIDYVVSVTDPGDTFSSAIKKAGEFSVIKKRLDEEMKIALEIKTGASEENMASAELRIKKVQAALDELQGKSDVNLKIIIDGVSEALNAVKSFSDGITKAISAFTKLSEGGAFKDFADDISSATASIGSAVAAIPGAGPVAAAITALGMIPEVISAISTALDSMAGIDVDKILKANEMQTAVSSAASQAAEGLKQDFAGIGETLGGEMMAGVKDGTVSSAADVEQKIRDTIYDMMASQLMEISGFKGRVAEIAAKMWEKIAPGAAEKARLKSQIDILNDQMANLGNKELLQKQLESMRQASKSASSTSEQRAQMDAASTQLQTQIDLITSYQQEIATLQGQYDAIGEIVVSPEIQNEAIAEATSESQKLIDQFANLKDALGAGADSVNAFFSSLSGDLQKSLTQAVLTGSYIDFKKAVYERIVSSIVEAVVQAGVVKTKIQAIMNTIFDESGNIRGLDSSGNIDAAAIIDQIRGAWIDVTDTGSPIGQLLMGLRQSLSDFGLLDISVNPGTVVTAIPSDVRDDLITAIRGTMESLRQAIIDAGLNSNVGVVNITTAYIDAMTASQILISQANMTLAGDMVFQMDSGKPLETWLEDFLTNYMARSAP